MKRFRKSNRVTWAPGLNLCQVRLFLTEDCPSEVGTQAQDHLQKKTSWMLPHLIGKEISDIPPGFEGSYLNPQKEVSSHIPMIEWKIPSKVAMACNWHVAVGEESLEAEAQKVREMRVLEAIFPRHAAIPSSPSIFLDVEEEFYNDSFTPVIPLTPIEEGAAADTPSDLSAPLNTLLNSQLLEFPKDLLSSGTPNSAEHTTPVIEPPESEKPMRGLLPDMGADLLTAVSAAATALMKSKEKGSLIDTGLLVKILGDPKMVEKLINYQAPISMSSAAMVASKPGTELIPASCLKTGVTLATTTNGNSHHLSNGLTPASMPPSIYKSKMLSVPMPTNGSFQVQPTVTRMSPQSDTKPVPGLEQPASVSLPRQQPLSESKPRSAVASIYARPDHLQSTSTMSAQPAPGSFLELKPNSPSPTITVMPVSVNGTQAKVVAMKTNPVKDINYIKNLIREHGSDKHNQNMCYIGPDANDLLNKEFTQNLRSKFQKPCKYYRSPKGCRNGSSCPYQHDLPLQFQTGGNLEVPSNKRMKLDGQITGRT